MLQKVELPVSDLFFMVDNSNYWKHLENNQDEADEALKENAVLFCELMASCGIDVESEDIIADWHERV